MYLYAALLLTGLVLVYFAVSQFKKTKSLLADGIKTEGIVIELKKVESGDGPAYKPVFEYFDQFQNRQTYTGDHMANPPDYKVGDRVPLIYNEGIVKIASFWGLYGWTVLWLILALPLLIIGGSFIF